MHRFFISPEQISKKKVTLVDEVAHQIRHVLRMRPGRKIIVLDNSGYEYYVTLEHIARNVIVGEIYDSQPGQSEPTSRITLYQGTLKAQKFEWVLQKGTEVGIAEFVPVIYERSVLNDVSAVDQKMLRWERIIQEAAEQSGRAILPELRPAMMFSQVCQRAGRVDGLHLLAWEAETEADLKSVLSSLSDIPGRISLFIGPEGGIALDEVRLAHGYGITPIGLGRRILRAETAGLVAASALLFHFDQLK